MRLIEIILKSIQVYKSNFKAIAVCVLIVAVPAAIALSLIPLDALMYTELLSDSVDLAAAYQNMDKVITMIKYSAYIQVINLFLVPIGTMAVAHITKKSMSGVKIGVKEAMETAFSSWGKLIATSIIMAVLIFIGLMLFMLPGLIVMVYVTFYIYAVVLDDKWGMAAIRRSFAKVRGRWWKTLLYIIILAVIGFGITELFAILSTPIARLALMLVSSEEVAYKIAWVCSVLIEVASQVFSAFLICSYTIWYLSIPEPEPDTNQ